jgi:hypothetical protein
MKTESGQHHAYTANELPTDKANPAVAPPAAGKQGSDANELADRPAPVPDTQKSNGLSTLAEYNVHAKYASAIVRQMVFADSRFNNSKLVVDTVLQKLQVKNGIVPPGVRLGTLGLTRLNSATANFSKATSYIDSAQKKLKDGADATDDIVSASALMGEGFTEVFAGLGADVGNYLVKQWQLELGKASSIVATPAPSIASQHSLEDVVHEAGSGVPIPEASIQNDVDAALAYTPAMSPQQHETAMAQSEQAYFERLDQQLHAMRDEQKQQMLAELDKIPDAQKPARLMEMSEQAQGKLDLAEELVAATRRDVSSMRTQRESDFTQLDEEMRPVRDQLKSGKYVDASVAGLSKAEAAERLGAKLLSYRRREEELAQGFELATESTSTSLDMLNRQVVAAQDFGKLGQLLPEERLDKLRKLKTDYRSAFLEYQKAISAPSENLPEWLKISPALKAQLGPAALNTMFAAADFGARVDTFIKKVASGTVTSDDKFSLAASTLGLVGGMSSFVPVFGPLISIGLSLAGIVLSDVPATIRKIDREQRRDALRDEVVDLYQAKHPGSENYVYKSDVGGGA